MNALVSIAHPWADKGGVITPRSAAVSVCNTILAFGGQASTAFACGQVIAEDLEKKQKLKRKT